MFGIHDRSPRFTFMNRATDGFTLRRRRDRAPKYHSTVPRSTRLREYPPSEKRICLTARSEEHTSELQSLMRSSYAVFCLKKQNNEYIRRHQIPKPFITKVS